MKNLNTIALVVLTLAVVGLYIMHFSCPQRGRCAGVAEVRDSMVALPTSDTTVLDSSVAAAPVFAVAYLNVDSLLLNYKYAKRLNETLLKKQEKSRKELTTAQQKLAAEMEVFQQKYQAGGFLTKESFEQEQTRLYKKEQELLSLEQRLAQELLTEQQKMNKQLRDTIDAFFETYNADKRFKLILSNTDADNVLYAEKSLNITNDVLEQLNERYAPKK